MEHPQIINALPDMIGPTFPYLTAFLVRRSSITMDSLVRSTWPSGVTSLTHLRQIVDAARATYSHLSGNQPIPSDARQLPTLSDDVKDLVGLELACWTMNLRQRFNADMDGPYIITAAIQLSEDEILQCWRDAYMENPDSMQKFTGVNFCMRKV